MNRIAQFIIFSAFVFAECFADSPLDCQVSGAAKDFAVAVNAQTPHAGEMAVVTPDGRLIWLQADHIPFPFPVTDSFELLSTFVLDRQSRGSWFNEWGEPEAVSVFSVNGEYELNIADNIESRGDDSASLSCRFVVTINDSASKD
jgi:hypothetical protein